MPSHDASIQWFEARKGKVVYSMSARLGRIVTTAQAQFTYH